MKTVRARGTTHATAPCDRPEKNHPQKDRNADPQQLGFRRDGARVHFDNRFIMK